MTNEKENGSNLKLFLVFFIIISITVSLTYFNMGKSFLILIWLIFILINIYIILSYYISNNNTNQKIVQWIEILILPILALSIFIFLNKKSWISIILIIGLIVLYILKYIYTNLSSSYVFSDMIGLLFATYTIVYFILGKFNIEYQDNYYLIGIVILLLTIMQNFNLNFFLNDKTDTQISLIKCYSGIFIILTMIILYYIFNFYISKIYLIPGLFICGIFIYILFSVTTIEKKQGVLPINLQPLISINDVKEDTLKKIIVKLNNFYTTNDCSSNNDGRKCSDIYKELINGVVSGKLTKESLDKLLKELSKEAMINQNIYLIYQLLQCKLLLSPNIVPEMGTWEWLFKYFLNNPFQIFIYILSAILMLIFIIYSVYTFVINNFLIDDKNKIIMFCISLIIITIIYLTLFNLLRGNKNVIDVPKNLYKYIDPKISDNAPNIDNSSKTLKWFMIITLIGISIITYFTQNNYLKIINNASWIGLIIAINLLYTMIIPQIILIGTLIQKFILMYSLNDINNINDLFILIGKILIFIITLVATLYSTQYSSIKKNGEIISSKNTNLLIWFLFGITVSFYIINIINSFLTGDIGLINNNYTLVLMPIVKYILEFINKEKLDFLVSISP